MKKAGYRGPKKFITAMKQLHISEGREWDSQLAQAQHRYNMSTARGLGPARQSEPLPFEKVADLQLNDQAIDPKMPANPAAVITLSTFYLLRELELSAARISDMMFNHELSEVRLRLSMSKNDATAKGTERPWRCICEGVIADAHRACPYHAAV